MPTLWVALPEGATKVAEDVRRWDVYHEACGMCPVEVDMGDTDVTFACGGCDWAERVPLEGQGTPTGRHNGAALERFARRREAQTLRTQTVMGGGVVALAAAALVGQALRVRIAPYEGPPPGREGDS